MYTVNNEGKKQAKGEVTSIYLYEMICAGGTDQSIYIHNIFLFLSAISANDPILFLIYKNIKSIDDPFNKRANSLIIW